MQKENISYNALITTSAADKSSASAAAPLHFSRSNPFLSSTSPTYVNSNASLYTSLFQNYSPNSPSDTASFDGGDTDRSLHDASCILEYQQLYNRYTLCLAQLHDSIEEVDALRRENDSLRLSNADLSHRVALLFSRDRLFSDFNRFNIASPSSAAPRAAHLTATQPLTEHNRVERRTTERVTLPKSISVRSSGYLKMTPPGRDTTSHKAVSQPAAASQRVYVPGSKKEEALELDVYNQGMWKTELCNKWQETGACPYGGNCQFAHGIKELRPVIRHPRYKTEVCRMVLAGDICPYGHRCHFRHSLTEEERLMAAPPPPRSSLRIQH
ncbi:hypothetical protein Pfo_019230 [Paulownia fortunei]|nr:hypothetical protein Pfo_019230 [Paulownia fortunei]